MAIDIERFEALDILVWYTHGVCKSGEVLSALEHAQQLQSSRPSNTELVLIDEHTAFSNDLYTRLGEHRKGLVKYAPLMPAKTYFHCAPEHGTDVPQLMAFIAANDPDINQPVTFVSTLEPVCRYLGVKCDTLQATLDEFTSRCRKNAAWSGHAQKRT